MACLALMPASSLAQRHNARPAPGNPYNTHISGAVRSGGFHCGVHVETVWSTADDHVYAAFSDDRTWYRVPRSSMHPLIYTAYSLGKKVCYQTKGYPNDDIRINVIFFDPLLSN